MNPGTEQPAAALAKALAWLLLGSALIAFATLSFVWAFEIIENLWAGYQDSPPGTYLLFGGAFLAVALVSGALGIRFFTWGYRQIR